MSVTNEVEPYLEEDEREKRWVRAEEALTMVPLDGLKAAISKLIDQNARGKLA